MKFLRIGGFMPPEYVVATDTDALLGTVKARVNSTIPLHQRPNRRKRSAQRWSSGGSVQWTAYNTSGEEVGVRPTRRDAAELLLTGGPHA